MRRDGALGKGDSNEGGYVLKLKPIGFDDRLEVGSEGKRVV